MSDSPVTEKWNEIKTVMETLELDVTKNSRGVAAAGVRARKGLRALRNLSKELIKLTISADKANKAAKPKKNKSA